MAAAFVVAAIIHVMTALVITAMYARTASSDPAPAGRITPTTPARKAAPS